MVRTCILSALLVLGFESLFAGDVSSRYTAKDYIETYKEAALEEMAVYGIPASITLGQAMVESDFGNSELARHANNHFGLKCKKDWQGATFSYDDDEANECFRKYDNVFDSYSDHSLFLRSRDRYSFLFELSSTDYHSWAAGLQNAGYATHPAYARKLKEVIEKFRLYELDRTGFIAPSLLEIGKGILSTNAKTDNKHRIINFAYGNFVVVRSGDTYSKISREFDIKLGELMNFNNAGNNDTLRDGDLVFIEPRATLTVTPYHTSRKGESLKSISKLYSIDLKSLAEKNKGYAAAKTLKPGTPVYLAKKK